METKTYLIEELLKEYTITTSNKTVLLDRILNEMLRNIGHSDGLLRDKIIYNEFCKLLLTDSFNRDQINHVINKCIDNLSFNIDEKNTDSVFTRSFSILFLHAIIYYDNQKQVLSEDDFDFIFQSGLQYFKAENDVRGWIKDKGWAHAPAHTSDFMVECVKSRYFRKSFVTEILEAIHSNLFKLQIDNICYIDDEDIRMSLIIVHLLNKCYISEEDVSGWLKSIKCRLESISSNKVEYYRVNKNYTDLIRALFFQIENFKFLQENIISLLKN